MHKILFTGPTLPPDAIASTKIQSLYQKIDTLEDIHTCTDLPDGTIIIAPPIAGGDIYKIRHYKRDYLIAIVDGFFENRISVWHREILHTLSNGTTVLGASSMGALRAAELSAYGMVGIGKIYEHYANADFEDDDEVVVNHGPADLGYPVVSEAMVNIRFTLKKAYESAIISEILYADMISEAKKTFYKKRNYPSLISKFIGTNREIELNNLMIWLRYNKIDQKRNDALDLLRYIDKEDFYRRPAPQFNFEDTILWRNSIEA